MPTRPTYLPPKNPADVVEYTVTFLGLAPDTIDDATVTGTGISIGPGPIGFTDDAVTFWASGGNLNDEGSAVITIETTGGRTIRRTVAIPIEAL